MGNTRTFTRNCWKGKLDKLPKVSVIIPTYNRADLLPRAIQSVLDQNFHDFELLVVDDGSTDNTVNIVQEFQAKDHRIQYLLLPENRGIGFARDIGLRHACGEYIAWIDSDDMWLPEKIKKQVELLSQYTEFDIVFTDFWNINHITGIKERSFLQNRTVMDQLKVRSADGLCFIDGGVERALLTSVFIHLQTAVFRSDLINRVGGFDIGLSGPEDFEFFWRAALLGAKFMYLDQSLVERHKTITSITANSIHSWSHKLESLRRCRRWCEKQNRPDLVGPVRSAQQRACRNLIWAHGRQRQFRRALDVYFENLVLGFSVKTLLFILIAMLGPSVISLISRKRLP